MAEELTQVPISIPQKFQPLYAEACDAPMWEDGSQHWYEFNPDAITIDESGNIIPQNELHRYGHIRKKFYIYYGGRGGGKSESMALISIIKKSMYESYIILCCREIQSSIKDSLYQTLKEWIDKLGLNDMFDLTEHEIRNKKTGGKFIFRGLRTNIQEIKSMKGVGLCIVDEAIAVSAASWKDLIPTLRLEGSEFWIGYNTRTLEDFTHKRFVINADERCFVCLVNIIDNPLAPKILLDEMAASRKLAEKTGDFDDYNNTWLGIPITAMSGGIFKTDQIRIVPAAPSCVRWVRGYDLAASSVSAKNPDPDFTASVRMGVTAEGLFVISDVTRIRETADVVERTIVNTASQDGLYVPVSLPQDGGGAGKSLVMYLTRALSGFIVHSSPESGSKDVRAMPFSSQCNVGNVVLVAGAWVEPFLNELKSFNGEGKLHDDQVDAASRSFSYLQTPYIAQMVSIRGL